MEWLQKGVPICSCTANFGHLHEWHINQTPSFQHYSVNSWEFLSPPPQGCWDVSEVFTQPTWKEQTPTQAGCAGIYHQGHSSARPPHPQPPLQQLSDISMVFETLGQKLMKSSHHQLCFLLLLNPSVFRESSGPGVIPLPSQCGLQGQLILAAQLPGLFLGFLGARRVKTLCRGWWWSPSAP